MKTWSMAVAAMVIGVTAGVASSLARVSFYTSELDPYADVAATSTVGPASSDRPLPKVEVVNGSEYNFGVMELLANQKHEFILRNTGEAPLLVTKEGTTCKCTISELPDKEIPPGGEVKVTLEWKVSQEGEFRQSADLHTNDPRRQHVRLTVLGFVAQTFQASPDEVVMGRISNNTPAKANVRLYSLRDDFEIESWEFADPATAEHFDVEIHPLSPNELPGGDQVRLKSGKLIEIHIKPGLPYGTLQQTIRVTTDVEHALPLEIPIRATVVSDISVIGGNKFVDYAGILRLGLVKPSEGASEQLHVLVKGSQREDVEVRVASVEPAEGLEATLGAAQGSGAVIIYPLTIRVPQGAPPLNRLGKNAGKVVLETTHPDVEQIEIMVQFAVEAPLGSS